MRLDVVTNGPVRLTGDPVALERVLTNLLDNAVRHARTRVELRVSGRSVHVADDGPGFAPGDLPHVFEPLFRGDRARAATTGGAGPDSRSRADWPAPVVATSTRRTAPRAVRA